MVNYSSFLELLVLVDLVVLFVSIMFLFVEERNVLCRTCEWLAFLFLLDFLGFMCSVLL